MKTDAVPSILSLVSLLIQSAIAEATKISAVFTFSHGIVEGLRGSLQDCEELHKITLSSLNKCAAVLQSGRLLSDVRTHLSAALTNGATCLEGLSLASGPVKPILVELLTAANMHVENSLGILPSEIQRRTPGSRRPHDERLVAWLSRRDSRLLQSGEIDDGYDPGSILTVAADGKGNFTTLGSAINFAPNNSADRTIIIVRAGVYEENVEVPSYKTNIVLLGDGSGITIIRGRRSAGDGWTTFRSATVGEYPPPREPTLFPATLYNYRSVQSEFIRRTIRVTVQVSGLATSSRSTKPSRRVHISGPGPRIDVQP